MKVSNGISVNIEDDSRLLSPADVGSRLTIGLNCQTTELNFRHSPGELGFTANERGQTEITGRIKNIDKEQEYFLKLAVGTGEVDVEVINADVGPLSVGQVVTMPVVSIFLKETDRT